MEKESNQISLDGDDLKLSKEILESLPAEFNIEDIGNIDLGAAERIANDDLLFLSEADLIEGLEEFDLIPVDDEMVDSTNTNESIDNINDKNSEIIPNNIENNNEILIDNNANNESAELDSVDEIIYDEKYDQEDEEVIDFETENSEKNIQVSEVFDENQNNKNFKSDISEDYEYSKDDEFSIEDILDGNIEPEEKIIEKEVTSFVEPLENWDILAKSVPIVLEALPSSYDEIGLGNKNLFFIDDLAVKKADDEHKRIFDVTELENLSSSILDSVEGEPTTLVESDIEKDSLDIMDIVQGVNPEFQDLLFEFEEADYRYRDDDIDFIHSTVVQSDYVKFISKIDEYYTDDKNTFVSSAVEILGLTSLEIDLFEDILYSSKYRDVDLESFLDSNDIHKIFNRYYNGTKECVYVVQNKDQFSTTVKSSIEEDISTATSIIFEEDIELIRSQLKQNILNERTDKIEIIDEVYDITDKIVILDDEDDIERLVNTVEIDKQQDMIKLMSYLDGLFEKLPEAAIKNFAKSEYFELYTEVLNKLGI